MKEKLVVTIQGRPGSGKTALAFVLKWHLRLWGFEVEVEDCDGDQDRPAEHHYRAFTEIAATRSVVIRTVQTRYGSLPK